MQGLSSFGVMSKSFNNKGYKMREIIEGAIGLVCFVGWMAISCMIAVIPIFIGIGLWVWVFS